MNDRFKRPHSSSVCTRVGSHYYPRGKTLLLYSYFAVTPDLTDMMASPGGSTTVSSRLVSYFLDADDVAHCEICTEAFDSDTRPPKLLPCGHNFCANCLSSLCYHQQYYLLDSISCPACRKQFDTSTAINAPTNYDLCKMLESLKKGQDMNVTVIHVADKSMCSDVSKINIGVESATPTSHHRQSKSKRGKKSIALDPVYERVPNMQEADRHIEYLNRCFDCKRSFKSNRSRVSRFCQRCYGEDKVLHLSCLECCVNRHNGHQLRAVDDLEYEHQRLLNDIRDLAVRRRDVSERFDKALKLLEAESNINPSSLARAKQTLMKESEKASAKMVSRMEDEFFTPLPPAVVSKMRNKQMHLFTRLQKMLTLVEKCHQSVQTRLDRQLHLLTDSLPKSGSSISSKSISTTTTKSDDSTTYNSLNTVLALAKENIVESAIIKKNLPIIVDEDLSDTTKLNALKQCIIVMNQVLNDGPPPEVLMLFQDAYLNCFHSLHSLSKRINNVEERKEIWSLVQVSMTELLRIASSHFVNYNADRVDLVADIAFLCNLYWDVSDTATMALCLIEAARSSVTQDQAESEIEKERIKVQLKLIDEHLTECRKMQQMRELCSNTKTMGAGRCSRFKRWFKSHISSSRSISSK
uniref:RING-type domain-containing protein n=1 Tax=Panagrellus redivivus TaxID=6233 RepID=A0A7E4VRX2_PANRE